MEMMNPPAAALGSEDMLAVSEKLAGWTGPTVWGEFAALAAETKAVNLGQGFPNWDPPQFVVDAAHHAIEKGFHQYTRTSGHQRLVDLLARRYTQHLRREVDANNEVAVTVGASQALFVALQVLVKPGDEVILLEPFFDLYVGQIRLAGGVPKFVPLVVQDEEWVLDADLLKKAVGPRTKVIMMNTPHNPTGKVFTRDEMDAVAEVVRQNPQLSVISDEVYKYIVHSEDAPAPQCILPPNLGGPSYDSGEDQSPQTWLADEDEEEEVLSPSGHIHFAKLPGMWDRTITVSSAGKTFSVTGWQVGWIVAAKHFTKEAQLMLPFLQFCAATPMQEALVEVIEAADRPYRDCLSYYDWMRKEYTEKREYLKKGLISAGIKPMRAEGGFFLMGDISDIDFPSKYMADSTPAMPKMTRDWAFCRYLAKEEGVVAIPSAPFFSAKNRYMGSNYVRFAFCKKEETLEQAIEKLKMLKLK